jgi:class 3 adenylate cyclase/predicted ATPase
MNCLQCQAQNPGDAVFCENCGARLEVVCPNCGGANRLGAKFCKKCGQRLLEAAPAALVTAGKFDSVEAYTPKHLAERILTSKITLEGERKQVTVLFADMKGSMELLADRDPEEARKLLDPVIEHMMEAVHRYEGTVSNIMGDGIMALFGAPLAHEDHAVRACYAALRMQESVKRYAEDVRRTEGVPIQIRVGLNSGEVVVGAIGNDLKMEYTAVGQTTHLAARMEQLATPGSILMTAETLRLAEGFVQVKAIGPVNVKGMTEPAEVYEIRGGGPARSRLQAAGARGLTRFVGRDAELDTLRQALEQAQSGHGQVVAVVGEPGVGKSRLFWEFTQSRRTQGWLILKSSSVSYGKATAYFPIMDLLRAYFKIQDSDDHRELREKISGKLLILDEALRPTLPAFLTLLEVPVDDTVWQELDPPQKRRRTLDAVKRLLIRESQVQPLMLIFEDLHWIDSETQALLDSLVGALPTVPILLLFNYRPEYQHGWGSKASYAQVRLDPLPPESADELLQAVLGNALGLQPLKQLLIARTEGNPFFIEESVRTLVETNILAGEQGAYNLVEAIESIQVPPTVQAVLAARIDRLPVEEKHLLQSAAVIGEDIPFRLLEAIAELPAEDLRRGVAHLQDSEFLYEASLFPDLEYTFKHGLTCQVAYAGLLRERRNMLHSAIVAATERQFADRLTEKVELLAHHAFKGELWSKAVTYLHQGGRKAALRSANREAARYFEQALTALARLPQSRDMLEQAIDIRVDLGPVLMATKGFGAPEVESLYKSTQELCDRFGKTPQMFPVLWGRWLVNNMRGQHAIARELGEQLLDLAERERDTSLLLQAHHALWTTLFTIGDLAAAKIHQERGLALYNPQRHRSHAFLYGGHDPGVCCRAHFAETLWMLGYPDQALKNAKDAVRLARELAHSLSITIALNWAALTHYHRREYEETAKHAKAMVELATEQEFPLFFAHGLAFLASSMVEEGHGEKGLAELEMALAAMRVTGATRARTVAFTLCLLAEVCARERQTEKGLETIAEGLAMEGNIYEPELLRIKGELLLGQDVPVNRDAEACFQEAIDLARSHSAKSLELRAAMSLCRLWQKRGKKEEARRMLAEIYGWFTEGFDTADLKAAKALLDELS